MGQGVWVILGAAALLLSACANDHIPALRTEVAGLQTTTSELRTVAARPTPQLPTAVSTATPVLAVVVRNTDASQSGCEGTHTQIVEWEIHDVDSSACFDPTGACVRLARIGGPLPAECGGVSP
jgi:hypothetical protein